MPGTLAPSRRAWIVWRLALALGLTAAFYALAVGVSLGLFWLAYADVAYTEHPSLRLLAFCLIAGGSVLWAIVPRPDRFQAPGPEVTPADEPRLFSAIDGVARATAQPMPSHVYLVNDVNAFVTQRGGFMGVGSHRVMGIGLPLLQVLTVDELESVLAHEFGHYHAGDVALGPWLHTTRAAIGRTIRNLSNSVLQKIFVLYGTLFLRVTHAVSRRQEFIADAVAARAVGAGPMIAGLRKVHGAAFAYQTFWQSELGPVLRAGHLPPVSDGFARFLRSGPIASGVQAVVTRAATAAAHDPYDTHPTLDERTRALAGLPQGRDRDLRPAASLLSSVERYERRILAATVDEDWATSLQPIPWDTVVAEIHLPIFRRQVAGLAHLLRPFTVDAIPATRDDLGLAGARLIQDSEPDVTQDDCARRMVHLLARAIVVALVDAGWRAEGEPGEEVALRRDAHVIRPLAEVLGLASGATTPAEWRARCAAWRVSGIRLGVAEAAAVEHGP